MNNKNNNNHKNKTDNNSDNDDKYKNSIFRPNSSGLINHLKKENERLRKLVISYEFKNKRYNNINSIYNTNNNNNSDFFISKFDFEILKKKKDINLKENYLNINNTHHNNIRNKDRKELKIINRDYKYNFSNKSIANIRKIKNISKIIKKPEIKKIKDINMFDNDYNYIKEKENRIQRYNELKLYNNTQKDRIGTVSLSQKKRKIFNMESTSMNSNMLRIKNIICANNRVMNNNILQQYKNLSSSRSLSKIIKRKKLNDFSFNSSKLDKKSIGVINSFERQLNMIKNQSNKNKIIKTIENRRDENSSLEKDIYFSSTSRQPKHYQIIKKKNKNNEIKKKEYYQKPIINKITIYNNINSGYNNYSKQKLNINEQGGRLIFGKKQIHNRYENNFNNYTLGI